MPSPKEIPKYAFLIVNGAEVFPLTKEIIRIGRKEDNDLTLRDKRVSRYHAQLQAKRGRYLLVDLNSKGGTSVNGKKIKKYALRPGDVISLAGVPLIYGESGSAQEMLAAGGAYWRAGRGRVSVENTDSSDVAVDEYLNLFEIGEETNGE
jgi:hypothetical protein